MASAAFTSFVCLCICVDTCFSNMELCLLMCLCVGKIFSSVITTAQDIIIKIKVDGCVLIDVHQKLILLFHIPVFSALTGKSE